MYYSQKEEYLGQIKVVKWIICLALIYLSICMVFITKGLHNVDKRIREYQDSKIQGENYEYTK